MFKVTAECDYCRNEVELTFNTPFPKFSITCENCGTAITEADIVDRRQIQ